jgi:3-oxoacyl-(acyl-carrier-protein) synthase
VIPYGAAPRGKAGFAGNPGVPFNRPARAFRMASQVAGEALAMAGLSIPERAAMGVIVTTCWGDIEDLERHYAELKGCLGDPRSALPLRLRAALAIYPMGSIATRIARRFGLCGPIATISNACASGNIACSTAQELVAKGDCAGVLVLGVERFTLTGVWGAERSGFVGRTLMPFDGCRNGTVLGEGAAALLLQQEGAGNARAHLVGSAMACEEGADIILFGEEGEAFTKAMGAALQAGGLTRDEVDLVSAHSPGTLAIDALETRAIGRLWRGASRLPAVNAFKSMSAHMSGASAVAEGVACVAQMAEGVIHGNAMLTEPDAKLGCPVMPSRSRAQPSSVALSNACGSGGINTSIALVAPSREHSRGGATSQKRHTVLITAADFVQAPDATDDWFDPDDWFDRSEGVWEMNRSGQIGAIAGLIAARSSRLFEEAGEIGRETAIVSGSWISGAPSATIAFCEGLAKNPPEFLPSMAFNNGSHLGSIILGRRLGLVGFTTTYCGHVASGLQALAASVRLVARGEVTAAIALSYDVTHPAMREFASRIDDASGLMAMRDGAGAVICEDAVHAARRGARVLSAVSGTLEFGDRLSAGHESIAAAAAKFDELMSGGVSRIVIASPAGAGLEALADRLAGLSGASRDPQGASFHSGAAQPAIDLCRIVPLAKPTVVLAGSDDGSKAAIRLDPA